jgi:uncharacterized protein (TIGR03067 family)
MKPSALTALLLTPCVLLAADPKPEDAEGKERAKLVGKWEVASFVIDGQKLPAKITKTMRATFTEKVFQTEFLGKGESPNPYRLDPSKGPKHMDLNDTVAEKGKDNIIPAIYSLDGDSLTLCFPHQFKDGKRAPLKRPAKFDASEGTGNLLIVFKRAKP